MFTILVEFISPLIVIPDPVKLNEPVITTFWFRVLTEEAVAAVVALPDNEPVNPNYAFIDPVTNTGPVLISTVPHNV